MFKKLLVLIPLLFVLGCEDNISDEPESTMKLWLNGEEVDVEANYKSITTYAEEVEYQGYDSSQTFIKKIFIIHFQKDAGRVEIDKEHYAVVFTDWEGDLSNGLPIDEGSYQWPSVCPVCPRACMHGAPSKWVRMEILGDTDYSISGTAHVDEISNGRITGEGVGTFYNPYAEVEMHGRIEFTDLQVESDTENTPYFDYGGH